MEEKYQEDLEYIKEKVDLIAEKVQYLCNSKVTDKEKLLKIYRLLRQKKKLFAFDIYEFLKISSQHAHNIMQRLSREYPESIKIQKSGNKNVLVYLSDIDKKIRNKILEVLNKKKELKLSYIMEAFGLDYATSRLLMQELAKENRIIEYSEVDWRNSEYTPKKLTGKEGIKLILKKTSTIDDAKKLHTYIPSTNTYDDDSMSTLQRRYSNKT